MKILHSYDRQSDYCLRCGRHSSWNENVVDQDPLHDWVHRDSYVTTIGPARNPGGKYFVACGTPEATVVEVMAS